MSTRYRLRIPHDRYDAMVRHALSEAPLECCGLLAGRVVEGVGLVTHHYPLVNAAASPTTYLTEPKSLLAALKAMRAADVRELAIYHSHPTSESVPSRRDRENNSYGDACMHLIISLVADQPEVRGWWLLEGGVESGEWDYAGNSEG